MKHIATQLLRFIRVVFQSMGLFILPIVTPLVGILSNLGLMHNPRFQKHQKQVLRSMFNPLAEGKQLAQPQEILRPVNVWFIVFSLGVSFLLNLLPWASYAWIPDFLALSLMFWSVREPRIISLGVAFLLGLLMDVHDATVLGEHALSYTLLSYAAAILSRRLPSFSLTLQALQVWPVFTVAMMITYGARSFFGGMFPGWLATLGAPLLSAILWPVVCWVLLAPQRRPLDIDENRPL